MTGDLFEAYRLRAACDTCGRTDDLRAVELDNPGLPGDTYCATLCGSCAPTAGGGAP